ncbi:MAG: threo-3-hydroxy-L-aspartate ammonia-lyase [Candidatus Obscuribacterales bacterium]|nr:threo-3-hydroxy-L-aspartate ammonia-lyase [Candidatus Obscuribacterales bacterium]
MTISDIATVNYDDILLAAKNIDGIAHKTPVLSSTQLNKSLNASVFFKCENFQRGGAFKFRGASNAITQLSPDQKARGVVAYSSGNHAQAVALAASLNGVEATIVMPSDAPSIKLAATRGYGAKVVLYDRATESREEIAAALGKQYGLSVIPPFDHPHVIAGQGTAALELIEEAGPLDYLFVCVGGGGLLSGSAIAAKSLHPDVVVVGVEPALGNDAQQSLQAGRIVSIDLPNTIADGAQTMAVGKITFPIMQSLVKEIITVTDDELCKQMRFFAERMKIVVEPTGCLAAAGVSSGKIDLSNAKVGVIVSGGNVDPTFFAKCISV